LDNEIIFLDGSKKNIAEILKQKSELMRLVIHEEVYMRWVSRYPTQILISVL
jgi:hypothetical protein